MTDKKYEKQSSKVTSVLTDGEVISYTMSAGPRIMAYATTEARASGFLNLRNDDDGSAISIPVAHIRNVHVEVL